ncbi:MAG TPA: site-2 protease family protein, partial [Verrucomicrobiae bacterium]|nr:site-2 protease family protein [Verrucomicrobiae bacterium]
MFNDPSYFITLIPALLIAFAFHEWAHATMADYLGDPTPRSQGRVNL